MTDLRTVNVTRYITPLREGGSLPAIAAADDGFLYALKFRGAGQGVKALIAELIGGELARAIGLKVPEIVFANLDEAFGRTEPDEEIQDLLKASTGLNIALHYLSGSITFDPAVYNAGELEASKIVWLDAFLANMDRTVRNTNILVWNKELWLIDHGACLYYHHSWDTMAEQFDNSFTLIREHALLPFAARLQEADAEIRQLLNDPIFNRVVDAIPESWLHWQDTDQQGNEIRDVYKNFLKDRFHNRAFFKTAIDARSAVI